MITKFSISSSESLSVAALGDRTKCFFWLLLKERTAFLWISYRRPIAFCDNTKVPSATAELPWKLP